MTYYGIKIIGSLDGAKLYYMAMVQSHVTHDKEVALLCCEHANGNFGNDGLLTGYYLKYEVVSFEM